MSRGKSFHRAKTILAGIEVIHMIRKGQYEHSAGDAYRCGQRFRGNARQRLIFACETLQFEKGDKEDYL